jgi:hypothetical protein
MMAMMQIWRMPQHDGVMGGVPWWHNSYNDAMATAKWQRQWYSDYGNDDGYSSGCRLA